MSNENNDANPTHASPMEAIQQATTRVSTNLLQRNGIDHLRILSESQFLEVLRRLQARRNLLQTGAPDGFGLGDEVNLDFAKSYALKWAELRSKHEQSLSQIESRMEKLSKAFSGIHGVMEKLGQKPSAPAGAFEGSQAPTAAEVTKQKSLLRQLLLTGDEPRA